MSGDDIRHGPDGLGHRDGAEDDYLDSRSSRSSWLVWPAIAIGAGLIAGLIAWRMNSQGGRHPPVNSAPSSPATGVATSSTGPTSGTTNPSAAATCPAGHRCRASTSVPPAALQAVLAHLPGARIRQVRNVIDSTGGALVYRQIVVTSDGFELTIWASAVADSLPSDASFTTTSGYHVKLLCSGPARRCPTATDPRLLSVR
jgi:hypothetical protein